MGGKHLNGGASDHVGPGRVSESPELTNTDLRVNAVKEHRRGKYTWFYRHV
jgi:hypothetical protein